MNESASSPARAPTQHFIRQIVEADLAAGRHARVVTRFPPEPNGYLHIGHAKSVCLNFGIAEDYAGICRLRFDDTNPATESEEFARAIEDDVRWLGFRWPDDAPRYASDYFGQLYEYAVKLIEGGHAYVCSLSNEQIREYRGTLTEPGRESPYRDRPVVENLDLFARMRAGEFADGTHVLRAKIDMSAPNLNMRDPVLYRVRRMHHYRTGERWCVYPMYDFTQCLSDAIEGVTHSLCTLEFEDHRPLYDWVLETLDIDPRPRQIEFSRLNLTHTVMSKRWLARLVRERHVRGWDDPRMPTLRGLRRRGFTPAAIRDFCSRIGVTKKENWVEMELLETCVREDLDTSAPRAMAVLEPLRVVIDNYPEHRPELIEAPNHPRRPELGVREVPFSRVLYIEREDFRETPPPGYRRLAPGREVRLRYAYFVRCERVVKDPLSGEVLELRCRYDPATRGGSAPDGRKVKGTLHWVSAAHALEAEVRLYDRLFKVANPMAEREGDLEANLNPGSLEILRGARLEPALAHAAPGEARQFERQGYFCADADGSPERPVWNRTVTLRDSWARIERARRG